MKKWICFAVTAVMLWGIPGNAFAEETPISNQTQTGAEEEELSTYDDYWKNGPRVDKSKMTEEELAEFEAYWENELRNHEMTKDREAELGMILSDTLPEDIYAGKYSDHGVWHIIPVEGEEEKAALQEALLAVRQKTKKTDSIIVDGKPGAYSLKELYDAGDSIIRNWNSLGIAMEIINERNNTMEVYALEWTEEKKLRIIEVAGLDAEHILFLPQYIAQDNLTPKGWEEALQPCKPKLEENPGAYDEFLKNVLKVDKAKLTERDLADFKAYWEHKVECYEGSVQASLVDEFESLFTEEDYAGVYRDENNILHYIPVEVSKGVMQKMLFDINKKAKEELPIIVDEEAARYSVQELDEAQERIWEYWDEFGLSKAWVEEKENKIMLEDNKNSKGWTEERKQRIIKAAGIDAEHIVFLPYYRNPNGEVEGWG